MKKTNEWKWTRTFPETIEYSEKPLELVEMEKKEVVEGELELI